MQIPFDITLPVSVPLQTKNLTCVYEQGSLRYIKYNNRELARMIYGAVRDGDWGTVPGTVYDEKIVQRSNSFEVLYTAKFSGKGIEYEASFFIKGNENDSLTFGMEGKALSSFSANRTGLCVHLPVQECCGRPCIIIKDGGEMITTEFPETIVPYQPFTGIQQIHWQLNDGTKVQLRFAGDVFEAEDQRNWMDHSYKIYSRPLSLPFPFKIAAGDITQQTIQVNVVPAEGMIADTILAANDQPVPVPGLGIAAADEPVLLTMKEIALLQALPFKHYRAELDFGNNWEAIFATHIANAKALATTLELVLFFTNDYVEEAALFLETLADHAAIIKTILPQHKDHKVTPVFLQQYFYPLVKAKFNNIEVGYGTDIYFTELNRQRPENDWYDFVCFSINPQVHSFDAKTMLENIETISSMVQTIRTFTGKPIIVSPVTLKKRKNHDGANASRHSLVENYDERQHTWFGAGWFLLCLYALHEVQQVCFFKTTGDSGLTGSSSGSLYCLLKKLKCFNPILIQKKHSHKGVEIIFRNDVNEALSFELDKLFLTGI
ncbi:MAG TPA: hypothetical protein PKE30_06015 [Niabella sp.]|nr:hypothetical protein [Niabella sp.]